MPTPHPSTMGPSPTEERAEVERARQAFERGEGIPLEHVMAELDAAD
jgi:hypothetical protein